MFKKKVPLKPIAGFSQQESKFDDLLDIWLAAHDSVQRCLQGDVKILYSPLAISKSENSKNRTKSKNIVWPVPFFLPISIPVISNYCYLKVNFLGSEYLLRDSSDVI